MNIHPHHEHPSAAPPSEYTPRGATPSEARPRGATEVWEARYHSQIDVCGKAPRPFVVECLPGLPGAGRALDVAMGEGRHALLLARHGLQVTGVDRSPTAVQRACQHARREGLHLEGLVADLEEWDVPQACYDVVVVTLYLQRTLFGALERALRPGGCLVYETMTVGQLRYGPRNPAWLLQHGELALAFGSLEVLRYEERDDAAGQLSTACLLARKPMQGRSTEPGDSSTVLDVPDSHTV